MLEVDESINSTSFNSVEKTDAREKNKQITVQEQPVEQSKLLVDEPLEESISTTQMEKVAQQLQDFVGRMNKGLEFHVHEESGKNVIKVVDKNNGELIKQFPSEEVLTVVARLSEAAGIFVNSKV